MSFEDDFKELMEYTSEEEELSVGSDFEQLLADGSDGMLSRNPSPSLAQMPSPRSIPTDFEKAAERTRETSQLENLKEAKLVPFSGGILSIQNNGLPWSRSPADSSIDEYDSDTSAVARKFRHRMASQKKMKAVPKIRAIKEEGSASHQTNKRRTRQPKLTSRPSSRIRELRREIENVQRARRTLGNSMEFLSPKMKQDLERKWRNRIMDLEDEVREEAKRATNQRGELAVEEELSDEEGKYVKHLRHWNENYKSINPPSKRLVDVVFEMKQRKKERAKSASPVRRNRSRTRRRPLRPREKLKIEQMCRAKSHSLERHMKKCIPHPVEFPYHPTLPQTPTRRRMSLSLETSEPIWQSLYNKASITRHRLEQMALKHQESKQRFEMQECTFSPVISKKANSLGEKRNSEGSSTIQERLYTESVRHKTKVRNQQDQLVEKRYRKEHPFQPSLPKSNRKLIRNIRQRTSKALGVEERVLWSSERFYLYKKAHDLYHKQLGEKVEKEFNARCTFTPRLNKLTNRNYRAKSKIKSLRQRKSKQPFWKRLETDRKERRKTHLRRRESTLANIRELERSRSPDKVRQEEIKAYFKRSRSNENRQSDYLSGSDDDIPFWKRLDQDRQRRQEVHRQRKVSTKQSMENRDNLKEFLQKRRKSSMSRRSSTASLRSISELSVKSYRRPSQMGNRTRLATRYRSDSISSIHSVM